MTGTELATLSTWLWIVATVSLFILLAEWSDGTSWGLTASIVRGVRGWADRDRDPRSVVSPDLEPLAPLPAPPRPIGGAAAARLLAGEARPFEGRPSLFEDLPIIELIDLGERHLPPP